MDVLNSSLNYKRKRNLLRQRCDKLTEILLHKGERAVSGKVHTLQLRVF